MDYILVFLSSLLMALYLAANKLFLSRYGNGILQRMIFIFSVSAFSVLLFLLATKGQIPLKPFSLIIALISSLLVFGYTLIGFAILQNGIVASYTLFLMLGGMIVPYVWGVLRSIFLNDKSETINPLSVVGIILMLTGIILFNAKRGENGEIKYIFYGVAVFFLNGFNSIVSKIHQSTTAFPKVTTAQFSFFNFFFRTVICFLILAIACRRKQIDVSEIKETISLQSAGILFGTAILLAASSYCLLMGAINLPATVIYPISTGGTIVLSSIVGRILFKEKLSLKMVVGLLLCFVGTCIFCI